VEEFLACLQFGILLHLCHNVNNFAVIGKAKFWYSTLAHKKKQEFGPISMGYQMKKEILSSKIVNFPDLT